MMKTILRNSANLIILLVFFYSLPTLGIITGQQAFIVVSPIPVACYMALATISAKKMWQKLWLNCLYWIGNIAAIVLAWNYVIRKYFPEVYEFGKSHPDVIAQAGINCVMIFFVSTLLFIAVYHFAVLRTKSEQVAP